MRRCPRPTSRHRAFAAASGSGDATDGGGHRLAGRLRVGRPADGPVRPATPADPRVRAAHPPRRGPALGPAARRLSAGRLATSGRSHRTPPPVQHDGRRAGGEPSSRLEPAAPAPAAPPGPAAQHRIQRPHRAEPAAGLYRAYGARGSAIARAAPLRPPHILLSRRGRGGLHPAGRARRRACGAHQRLYAPGELARALRARASRAFRPDGRATHTRGSAPHGDLSPASPRPTPPGLGPRLGPGAQRPPHRARRPLRPHHSRRARRARASTGGAARAALAAAALTRVRRLCRVGRGAAAARRGLCSLVARAAGGVQPAAAATERPAQARRTTQPRPPCRREFR